MSDLTWTYVSEDTWRRSDGAYVTRSELLSQRRPWYAVDPYGQNLCGRLYADWDIGTGATRTFATAKAAMNAIDKTDIRRASDG